MKRKPAKIKFLLLLFCGLLLSNYLFAQRAVTGTVTDAGTGEGLITCPTVQVRGTSLGTVTDLQGNYTIEINSSDDVLVFSYIGYETAE